MNISISHSPISFSTQGFSKTITYTYTSKCIEEIDKIDQLCNDNIGTILFIRGIKDGKEKSQS